MQKHKRILLPLMGATVLGAASFIALRGVPDQLDFDIDRSAKAQEARERDPWDLTRADVLQHVVLKVKDEYVDPERVDYRRMFLSGLNAIQHRVAPVIVRYERGAEELELQVRDQRHTFRVGDVTSPWVLTDRFREVFGFLQPNLEGEAELNLRDVEYAAITGMLRTLDPHTNLLTPEMFEDMRMNTQGAFGGLGIVISMRDGHLTVIRPIPNTPASEAGIQRGDRIIQINDESTLNLPLSEAVSRLRGEPRTSVDVWIQRRQDDGSYGSRQRVRLTRAIITIQAVEHRMLEQRVGYVKINSFQRNTHSGLVAALDELSRGGMRGLVLDLRGNPGGLLGQAVQVADTFLGSGTIVTTSARSADASDEHRATRRGTQPDYPMVVLINGSSASASEIVAGALKNHDRALIVGTRSFGKGSVQVIRDLPDRSGLKITIAQYLTPGDISIQGVGIVPDIAIEPMTADVENMDLAANERNLREADLAAHLTHASAREGQRPALVMRYYLDRETRRRIAEHGADEEENESEEEFLLSFSRSLVAGARRGGRVEMLTDARPVLTRVGAEEETKLAQELRRLGVDWAEGRDEGASTVTVELSTDRAENRARAGEPFHLVARVTNTGEHTLYRLRARTASDYSLFNERELVFGRLAPGETREWRTNLGICRTQDGERRCRLPFGTRRRADGIRVTFEEAHGHVPEPAEIRTEVEPQAEPVIAYGVYVADAEHGNGDGRIQRGERAEVYFRIKNVGTGPTHDAQANLRSRSGSGLLLRAGRFQLGELAPGEERMVTFSFELTSEFAPEEIELDASVVDADFGVDVKAEIELPVSEAPSGALGPRRGSVTLGDGTALHAGPNPSSDIVGHVRGGGLRARADAMRGEMVRVRLDGDQPVWVRESELGSGRGGRVEMRLEGGLPNITLEGTPLVTNEPTIRLRGNVVDGQRVLDLYIFATTRKVFYASNQRGDDPRRMSFDTSVPLHAGLNYITVFARESDGIIGRHTVVVRRDGPNGELLETPRRDEDDPLTGVE